MGKTKVLILGVGHSLQLASKHHHPGVFRGFFESVKPDAICIERSPEKYAASDYYEFTYEQQYLTIPYALEKNIPIYPIDWMPALNDQRLVYGNAPDHEEPSLIRSKTTFISFHGCFPYSEMLNFDFFMDDKMIHKMLKKDQEMLDVRNPGIGDYWRRLVLYRTFMQAMRIKEVAKKHSGQTILVLIGGFHKPDIENILMDNEEMELIQPSTYKISGDQQQLQSADLFAIATYNLLGIQPKYGTVDWDWVDGILKQLENIHVTDEVALLRTRYQVLTNKITTKKAIETYKKIGKTLSDEQKLTFNGVKYLHRIDSYFDPFGYMSVKQRIALELAREYYKLKLNHRSKEIKEHLLSDQHLSFIQKAQIEGYWDQYVIGMK